MENYTSNQAQKASAYSQDTVLSCMQENAAYKMLMNLPVCLDWVNYKGEDIVIQWNYQATQKAGKPMVDISYCMTKALNQEIDQTVQWDNRHFKPSQLGSTKW